MSDSVVAAIAIIATLAVPLGVVAWVLARQYRSLKERQWTHEETMTALRQGIAVDMTRKQDMTYADTSELRLETKTNRNSGLFWMRALAAFFGALGISLGTGILAAFTITSNAEANEFWPMGLIPMFGGFGMLALYVMLTYFFSPERRSEDGNDLSA